MQTGFVTAPDGARIQFACSASWDESLTPILFVPGMLGTYQAYEREIRELAPRRVISFSHRGLGESTLPAQANASFLSRVSDIGAVTRGLGLKKYFLGGFSRGVSLCVQHALDHAPEVAGLVLIDCDAAYFKPGPQWIEWLRESSSYPIEIAERYAADASSVNLNDSLADLISPVLLIRGEQEGSLLPAEMAQSMRVKIKRSHLLSLPHSGHGIEEADFPLFKNALSAFMKS